MKPKLPEEMLITESSSGLREGHYSVTYDRLPPEFQKIAERDLNETEDKRIRGIQHLKEYMKKEKLPFVKDALLLAVLRHAKYNTKKAEAKLKAFVEKRKLLIQLLQKMGMDKIESILRDQPVGALPYRDREGRLITFSNPSHFDFQSYEVKDALLVMWVIKLFFLSYPLTSVTGFVYFAECKSPSISFFVSVLQAIRRDMHIWTSFPVRFARVEILNENRICRCFVKFIKAVVSQKIIDRIVFHGDDIKSLHNDFHPDILPDDFGGNMGPVSNATYKQQLLDFIEELLKEGPGYCE